MKPRWSWLWVWVGLIGAADAAVVQFDIGTAANKDVIYEGGAGTQPFGENQFATEAFAVNGYNDGTTTANGLPASGVLASSQPGLGNYQLLPFNGANVVELYTHNSGPFVSHLIDIPNQRYAQIGLLVSAVEGDASFTIQLHYTDGTEVAWWEADDWFDTGGNLRPSQQVIISGMDRVNVNTGQVEDSNHFSLFEFLVTPDADRVLTGITIGNDPNRWPDDQHRWAGLFAMNGQSIASVPEPSSMMLIGIGAVLLRGYRLSRSGRD